MLCRTSASVEADVVGDLGQRRRVREAFEHRVEVVLGVADLVDAQLLGLAQLPVVAERFLLEEAPHLAAARQELLVARPLLLVGGEDRALRARLPVVHELDGALLQLGARRPGRRTLEDQVSVAIGTVPLARCSARCDRRWFERVVASGGHLKEWSPEPIEESVPSVYILPDQQLVECGTSEAVLPAALRAGVPFAHACGGHAVVLHLPRRRGGGMGGVRRAKRQGTSHRRASRLRSRVPAGLPDECLGARHDAASRARRHRP